MDASGLNYVSLAYPFILFDRNIVVSLNYQRLFEMDKDVSFNLSQNRINIIKTWECDGIWHTFLGKKD